MTVLQFEIEDQLIQHIGISTIQEFLEQQLALLRVTYLGEKISQVIQQSGIDHAQEVEEARQEAWHDYKTKYGYRLG
jgi:hypothetical protein